MGSLLKPTTETINIDSLNLENGTYVIGTGMSGTKPFEYGILIQFKRYTYTIDIDSAAIAKRQTNNERWPNWDFYVTKSDLFTNVVRVTDVHGIGKNCLFRAEHGAANTPTRDVGYIGLSVYIDRTWQFVICSPYAGGKLFFDSVNVTGSWIGWKEISFK